MSVDLDFRLNILYNLQFKGIFRSNVLNAEQDLQQMFDKVLNTLLRAPHI